MLRRLGIDLYIPKNLKAELAWKTSSTLFTTASYALSILPSFCLSKVYCRLENSCFLCAFEVCFLLLILWLFFFFLNNNKKRADYEWRRCLTCISWCWILHNFPDCSPWCITTQFLSPSIFCLLVSPHCWKL